MINLYETIKNTGSYDNAVRPLYVRCKANISTVKGSDVYSNVVEPAQCARNLQGS